jgi:hypothetical protein
VSDRVGQPLAFRKLPQYLSMEIELQHVLDAGATARVCRCSSAVIVVACGLVLGLVFPSHMTHSYTVVTHIVVFSLFLAVASDANTAPGHA